MDENRLDSPSPHASPLAPHAILISDLHLSPDRPGVTRAFMDFLQGPACLAVALYVLGDLFDYWLGDDDLDAPLHAQVIRGLRRLSHSGVSLFLMVGNRDFLLHQEFARATMGHLLPDPTLVNLAGVPTLLMHGDSLCTDDHPYQAFRDESRTPAWRSAFLAKPLEVRRAIATGYRRMSEEAKGSKVAAIMDVSPKSVAAVLREHALPRLIHGHTHRPVRHEHVVDGHVCERWVLPDWREGEGAVWLECSETACRYRTSQI